MRIAIIGAGFCGLAVAWHLLNHTPRFPISSLVVFDAKGIGNGASGIAAGLLHPFAGAHAKLNRMGKEGMNATQELLDIATKQQIQPLSTQQGILRLALTTKQKEDFLICQAQYPSDVEWLEVKQCQELFPDLTPVPGLWIKQGITIHSTLYLHGLWQACAQQGASLELQQISSCQELADFDLKIITTGAAVTSFPECSHLPISIVKGQVLELEWPNDLPSLPFTLNSQAYLIMNEKSRTCLAGATFERVYQTAEPDPKIAEMDILPKVIAMLPKLKSARLINCYAGLRAVTPSHLPIIEQIGKQEWVLTGMGSKGLLYHALMAKELVKKIGNNLKTFKKE